MGLTFDDAVAYLAKEAFNSPMLDNLHVVDLETVLVALGDLKKSYVPKPELSTEEVKAFAKLYQMETTLEALSNHEAKGDYYDIR